MLCPNSRLVVRENRRAPFMPRHTESDEEHDISLISPLSPFAAPAPCRSTCVPIAAIQYERAQSSTQHGNEHDDWDTLEVTLKVTGGVFALVQAGDAHTFYHWAIRLHWKSKPFSSGPWCSTCTT